MAPNLIEQLAILRIVVGYLGEKDQFAWWTSSFFAAGSEAFLSPVFPKTQLLAQCTGVSQAAALVHDDRIGTGDVYHLFRLPEELAQDIHDILQEADLPKKIAPFIADQASALDHLTQNLDLLAGDEVGPVLMGDRADLRSLDHWSQVQSLYAKGFSEGHEIFPYFAGGGR